MPKIYRDEAGDNLQTVAIESLAAEFHMPVEAVQRAYEEQLARLKSGAQIQDFLAVFAIRNTRATLRHAGR
jgi:hypothetical protein